MVSVPAMVLCIHYTRVSVTRTIFIINFVTHFAAFASKSSEVETGGWFPANFALLIHL